MRSAALVPVSAGGQDRGTLAVFTVNRAHRFTPAQIAMVEVVAQQAGALISQDELYEELETSYRATVEALTNALSVKDAYTSEHVREIAELALAPRRRLPARAAAACSHLEYAAILHDIGKIGVPTEILTKPGPLDDGERADRPAPHRDRPVPAQGHPVPAPGGRHRARRPRALGRHRLPATAWPASRSRSRPRIIFVCDAWHAMRSDRPYRAALEVETAARAWPTAAGTQFDPNVVEIFLRDIAQD